MLKNLLGRVASGVVKTVGALKEPVRKIGQIGYKVGKFAVDNHQYLAPLIHGVAMASGNETAQKITGGILALSKTASLRQNLNASNEKIKTEMNRGGYGSYNAMTGKMSNYN
jgi:hypothetical protein